MLEGSESDSNYTKIERGTSAFAARNRERKTRAHARALRRTVVIPIISVIAILIVVLSYSYIWAYVVNIYAAISDFTNSIAFVTQGKTDIDDVNNTLYNTNINIDNNAEANAALDAAINVNVQDPLALANMSGASTNTTDFTMFRGDAARSLSGVGTVTRRPKLLWRFKTKTKLEGPYEKRGTDKLNDLSPWPGLGWTGQPVRLANRVYFGSSDSRVYCIDLGRYGVSDDELSAATNSGLATGDPRLVWYYETHHSVKGSITIFDDLIYHGGRDNKIHCYTLDGKMVWETRTGNDMDSNPVVVDGRGYIGGEDHNIYCFDPITGTIIWKFEGKAGSFEDSPCVFDDSVVLGTSRGILFCVNKNTGILKWKRTTNGDTDSTPVYSNGKLFVSCATGDENEIGYFWCIDAETGETVWQKSFKRGFWATAAVNESAGTIYIGNNNGMFYCLRMSDGEALWKRNLGSRIWSSAVVVDKCVVVGVRDGRVWCLAEGTGKPIWVFDCGGDIDATPLVAGGLIVIGNQDGWVYCIGDAGEFGTSGDGIGVELEPINKSWFIAEFPEKMLTAKGAVAYPPLKRTSRNSTGIYTINNPSPAPGTYTDTNSGNRDNYLKPVYGEGRER